MNAFWAVIKCDLRLAIRLGGGIGLAVIFFVLVATLVPLGLGPDLKLLARIAPGILWIGVLLSMLLSLDRLFQADFEEGVLDLYRLSPLPLELTIIAKVLAHWLATGVPLLLATPFVAMLLNLPGHAMAMMMLSIALGSPALSFIGAIGAALTVSVRRGGLLLSLLVLPLYVPVLIFGISITDTAGPGGSGQSLALLAALSLFSLIGAPLAAAAALRAQ